MKDCIYSSEKSKSPIYPKKDVFRHYPMKVFQMEFQNICCFHAFNWICKKK